MKKKMRKAILAFCVTLSVFVCSSLPASAAVCSGSPDGVHHFHVHVRANAGYAESGGTHKYLYGYDQYEKPIYKYDCEIQYVYQYCNMYCRYCPKEQENSQHVHMINTTHSVNHN